jgi:hypothetical protein
MNGNNRGFQMKTLTSMLINIVFVEEVIELISSKIKQSSLRVALEIF